MKIAVITPYCGEPNDWLAECHESVKCQTHPATHILVADGQPKDLVSSFDAQHIILPITHRDYGDTPRALGSLSAARQGFDAVAYLDADNWYADNHIETLVGLLAETSADVCTSKRSLHRLDGTLLGLCHNSDGQTYSDTSCMMLTKAAFHLLPYWALMPEWRHPIGDRVMWHKVKAAGCQTTNTGLATVAYRTTFHGHYEAVGEVPPAELGEPVFKVEAALDRWEAEGNPSLKFELAVEPATGGTARV